MTTKRNVLIGITGGIASYKIPYLIRLFKKNGFNVKVVATKNALKFVGISTLETLTGNRVCYDLFQTPNIDHIEYAKWADVLIVAPATANIIGKMANGICDDALSTTIVACDKDVILCPAMNTNMYFNYAVQRNINFLKENGVHILGPVSGELSCGDSDVGRMIDVDAIYHYALRVLYRREFWRNKKVVLVGGGTREYIDDVRYIGNASSGKMSVSLLKELYYRGANITFICASIEVEIPHLEGVRIVRKISVNEILNALKKEKGDILIMPAAISDFSIERKRGKIKREKDIVLNLRKTPDIIGIVSQNYRFSVGFSLDEVIDDSEVEKKIKNKNLNMVVANDIGNLGAEEGRIVIYSEKGKINEYIGSKESQSSFILDAIEKCYEKC